MNCNPTGYNNTMHFIKESVNVANVLQNIGTENDPDAPCCNGKCLAIKFKNGVNALVAISAIGDVNRRNVISKLCERFCLVPCSGTNFKN